MWIYTAHIILRKDERSGDLPYIPPLTGKPEQWWFTIPSGVLTSISTIPRLLPE